MDAAADTFDAARQLPSDRLRELLAEGAPRTRVWAAWALGLRLGRDVVPPLSDRVSEEPLSGVRRHFVRMFAGFEAFEMLRTLARTDPDPLVRRDAREFLRRCADTTQRSTEDHS